MKILVTGAAGYLGIGIVTELLNRGHDVIAASIKNDLVDNRAKKYNANIFENNNPYEYYGQPDIVLHLAWRNGFMHMANTHIEDLPSHCKFLMDMIDSGCKKICVMGSVHEIGFFEGSIDENTPCKPLSYYGIAKNALRDYTQILCKTYNTIFQWIRGFYIVGNSIDGCSVFSKIVQAEKEGKDKFPFTKGQNMFDFLDYNIFCKYVCDIVLQDDVVGIINCCNGRPMKLADRVEKFIKDNNFKIKLEYGKFPDRPYDSKAIWGNDNKLQKILNKEGYDDKFDI